MAFGLVGCSLISAVHPAYTTPEQAHALAARLLSEKYQKEFRFVSEHFDKNGYGAKIVGVDDNPAIVANAMVGHDGVLWDNYSGVTYKLRVEAPTVAACKSAPAILTCAVVMDLPMGTSRWDGVSFEDFVKQSPVTNTVDVTYAPGMSNDQLADLILPLVNALYKVPVSSFLRVKVNGQGRAAFNLDVSQPPKIDRGRIMDELTTPPLASPGASPS